MQPKNTYINLSIILLFVIGILINTSVHAQNQDKHGKASYVRVGIDAASIVRSTLSKSFSSYELHGELRWNKNLWMGIETGWGNAQLNNQKLSYTNQNMFLRVGFDKTFFQGEFKGDMDNAFLGFRYGLAPIKRSALAYNITDPVWGMVSGQLPSQNYFAHWIELTAGLRLEVIKNIFVGWNLRARTYANPSVIGRYAPLHIAGYGTGDKNPVFTYNFVILYGIGNNR